MRMVKDIPMRWPATVGNNSEHGFTLIELIVVMVIVGILAVLGGLFIARPIEGFLDLSRRATLVDAADNALRRMQRDIRQALPNSVHIECGGACIELLHTVDGGRYRSKPASDGSGDVLDFIDSDEQFDVLGALSAAPTTDLELVVYNLAPDGIEGNAYHGDNRRSVAAGSGTTSIKFSPSTPFVRSFPRSPYQRFFLVDTPVSYVCDTNAGTLTRHAGYAISDAHGYPPAGGTSAVMTRYVTGCSFSYSAGTFERAGLVTMRLQLGDEGETITLFQQVHVDNAP